jgi:hypothetical protein
VPYGSYPPPAFAPPIGGPPVSGPTVWLRTSNPRARLQQLQLKWVDLCVAPCGRPADPNALYRIGGGSIKPSPTFKMPRPAGEVRIDAETGSIVKFWVGVGLAIGGAAAAAGGGALYLSSQGSTNALDRDTFRVEGIVYLVTGVVLLAVGLPLWLTNNTTIDVR